MSEQKRANRQTKSGTLIIIGGHEDHDGDCIILKEVASRISNGKLVLATIASHEPEGYLEKYQNSFGKLGISEVFELYLQDRIEASAPEKLGQLAQVQAVFFSGGDQLRITSQIGDTPIEEYVHQIYQAGGVIAGTSAGASAMSETMLVRSQGSTSYRIGDMRMAPGLGLLPGVIIDQHFAERGRIGRLIGAVAQNPRVLGIGIDEDTAIVVRDGSFKVIGSGAVYLVDGAGVTHSNITEGEADTPLSIYDLKLHVLSSGDAFDLHTRRPELFNGPLNMAEK